MRLHCKQAHDRGNRINLLFSTKLTGDLINRPYITPFLRTCGKNSVFSVHSVVKNSWCDCPGTGLNYPFAQAERHL